MDILHAATAVTFTARVPLLVAADAIPAENAKLIAANMIIANILFICCFLL